MIWKNLNTNTDPQGTEKLRRHFTSNKLNFTVTWCIWFKICSKPLLVRIRRGKTADFFRYVTDFGNNNILENNLFAAARCFSFSLLFFGLRYFNWALRKFYCSIRVTYCKLNSVTSPNSSNSFVRGFIDGFLREILYCR